MLFWLCTRNPGIWYQRLRSRTAGTGAVAREAILGVARRVLREGPFSMRQLAEDAGLMMGGRGCVAAMISPAKHLLRGCGAGRAFGWTKVLRRPRTPDPCVVWPLGEHRGSRRKSLPRLPCVSSWSGSGGEPPHHLARALPVHGQAHRLREERLASCPSTASSEPYTPSCPRGAGRRRERSGSCCPHGTSSPLPREWGGAIRR